MNTKLHFSIGILCLTAALLAGLSNPPAASAQESRSKPAEKPPAKIRFRPPVTGAPSVRVTGGSRGSGDATVTLDVLAPDDVGVTTQEQPSLFWFQSKPATAKFELTLLQEKKAKPLLQLRVDRSTAAGIHRLKLSEHGVKLAPGVEYQWVVALISDPDNRSSDLVASGVIKHVQANPDLQAKLANAAPNARASVYADAGIWYDALAVLTDQIEANPQDPAPRQARADLLEQVGLKAASQAEGAARAK